jgi:hypothetical protein
MKRTKSIGQFLVARISKTIAVFYHRNDTVSQPAYSRLFLGDLFVAILQVEVGIANSREGRSFFIHKILNILFIIIAGDLYGGAHYSQSASANLTLQGKAIRQASIDFGDGRTLPFSPCKNGFIPLVNGHPMFACLLHDNYRRKRFKKEGDVFRKGEVDLYVFWESKQLVDSRCCMSQTTIKQNNKRRN